MLIAIGMTLELSTLFKPWPVLLSLQGLKYVLTPALALGCIALSTAPGIHSRRKLF